jgi:hypothetical protein
VAPFFEVFAGIFELTATVLLLFRRTTTLGALMMIAILLPIWFVNIGYNAGVQLASMHILVLSLVLLVRDLPRFWQILVQHKNATLTYVQPFVFAKSWKRTTSLTLKVIFIFLFLIYRGYEYGKLYAAGKTFKLPLENGVKSFTGYYNVEEFRLNNRLIPYSPDDTLRWQNVVFEKFNTLSVKLVKKFALNTQNKIRTTEYYGNVGRLFYGYEADTLKQILVLRNRADTASGLKLAYSRPSSDSFILKGIDEHRDSIYVVLKKINKTYPLLSGRN